VVSWAINRGASDEAALNRLAAGVAAVWLEKDRLVVDLGGVVLS
jgi:hypothetical protein